MNTRIAHHFFLAACALLTSPPSAPDAQADSADELSRAIGIRGGLIVHLGCGDGALTETLLQGKGMLIHGLASDVTAVSQARTRIMQSGNPVVLVRVERPHLLF